MSISSTNESLYLKLVEPFTYLRENTKGKGFRNTLLSCFNLYFNLGDDDLKLVQEVIDILHNSSLLIDDVEDDGVIRRGVPCAHRIFGIGNTINAGNMMYFKAWESLLQLNIPRLSEVYVASMMKLHFGQGLELYWRDNKKCPTEEEYLEMVVCKTGELFKLGVTIMECVSINRGMSLDVHITEGIKKFCDILGMFYQIKNDVDDLVDGDDGIEFAHDLKEGKYSFPIQYCINMKNMKLGIGKKDMSVNERRVIVTQIADAGGIRYSQEYMFRLQGDAQTLLHSMASLSSSAKCDEMVKKLVSIVSKD